MRQLDTRSWNLFAGVAGLGMLVGACGDRTIGAEGSSGSSGSSGESSESSESTDATTQTAPTTQEGDECQDDDDCPPSYYCTQGMCEYIPAPDGGPWYECYTDADCGALSLCESNYCDPVSSPPSCAEAAPIPIPIPVSAPALGLSFANVDGVLGQELIVASEELLHVIDINAAEVAVAPRDSEGPVIAMGAGSLLGIPGDDVVLLQDVGELARVVHPGDGAGSFEPSQPPQPVGLASSSKLRVIDLGGQVDATVVWGSAGAELFGELELQLSSEAVQGVGYRRPSFMSESGVSLLERERVRFFDLELQPLGELAFDDPDGTGSLTSMWSANTAFDVASRRIAEQWTLLSPFLVDPPGELPLVGLSLRVAQIVGGDLDANMRDDLVLRTVEGELWIFRDMSDIDTQCLTQVELPGELVEVVVGDHDGNGDEEFALRFADGSVALLDAGV